MAASDDEPKNQGVAKPPSSRAILPWELEEESWAAHQELEAQQAAEEEARHRDNAIDEMVEWFFQNFEDPQNETPYDKEDGVFIYPFGGPFDAPEMLESNFDGVHPSEWIEAAVETIQKGGTFEWAPTSRGDYYEHPDIESDELAFSGTPIGARILRNVDAVERLLAELPTSPPNIGHNNPPDDIGLPPYTDEDRQSIGEMVIAVRLQMVSDEPDSNELQRVSKKLDSLGQKIAKWFASKADLAVDELIKTGIKVAGYCALAKLLSEISADLITVAGHVVGKI